MKNIYKEVGEALRWIRQEEGYSNDTVGKALGIFAADVCRYELGRSRIPLGVFCRHLLFYEQSVCFEPNSRVRNLSPVIITLDGLNMKDKTELGALRNIVD